MLHVFCVKTPDMLNVCGGRQMPVDTILPHRYHAVFWLNTKGPYH